MRGAAGHYAERNAHLGKDFGAEVERVVALVAERPEAGASTLDGRRRWLLTRFPFAVVYRLAANGSVRVLAVAHHRRRPGYWQARV